MLYKATLQSLLRSTLSDGQCDRMLHKAHAVVALRDDGTWKLKYYDEENAGETVISGTSHAITLRRSGHVTSRMVFETSKTTEAIYRTEAREIDMQLYTRRIFISTEKHSGRLLLDYDLLIAGETTARNTLEVFWHREIAP